MCHECDDYESGDKVQFNSSYIDELQEAPEEVREEVIEMLMGYMSYIMEKAEENGFLFEMITEWPRQKVAVYEAAIVMQKNILDDEE